MTSRLGVAWSGRAVCVRARGCRGVRSVGAVVLAACAWPAAYVSPAAGQTFVWIGGQTLNWNQADNWQPAQVPGVDVTGANVVVQTAGGVVQATSTMTLGDLITDVPVRFWGITAIVNTATVTDLILQNATFDVQDVIFNGTTQWNYGLLQGGPGSPAVNQGLILFPTGLGTGTKEIRRKKLTNLAAVEQASGITVTADAEIDNQGQWDLFSNNSSFTNFTPGLGGALFKNSGTLRRNPHGAAIGGSTFSIPFENTGTVVADGVGAEVHLQGGSKVGGSYNVADGGHIRFGFAGAVMHELDSHAQFNGLGEVRINSGVGGSFHIKKEGTLFAAVNPSGTGQGFHVTGGYPILLDGTIHNSGTMRWSQSSISGQGRINNDALLNIAGGTPLEVKLVNMDGGEVRQTSNCFLGSNIEIDNQEGATWFMIDGHLLPQGGSSGNLFRNRGNLTRGPNGNGANLSLALPLLLDGGEIEVHGGGGLRITAGGELKSGTFRVPADGLNLTMESGVYLVTGGVSVDQGSFTGAFRLSATAELRMSGGNFTNNWSTVTSGGTNIEGAITSVGGGGEFINNGKVRLNHGARIGTSAIPAGTYRTHVNTTIDAGFLVEVRGTLFNHGVVIHYGNVHLHGGSVDNVQGGTYLFPQGNSTMHGFGAGAVFNNRQGAKLTRGTGAGQTNFSGTAVLNNEGTVEVKGGTLSVGNCAQVVGNTLTGGHWVIHNPGVLQLGQGVTVLGAGANVELKDGFGPNLWSGMSPATLERNSNLTLDQASMQLPSLHNQGTVHLLPGGSAVIAGPTTNPGGVIIIEPGGNLNSQGPLTNDEDKGILGEIEEVIVISLAGSGGGAQPMITTPALNNNALLIPGGRNAPGPFNLTGTLNQGANGRIHIELGGTVPITEHDQMRIYDGDANLAGVLVVELLAEFAPRAGATFDVLTVTNGSVSGAFDAIHPPPGHRFSATYATDRVVLIYDGASPPGDLNGDGVVNVFDLLILLGAWGPCPPAEPGADGSCPADLHGDGAVDVFDLLILLGNWG
jgi:hypothetical protein